MTAKSFAALRRAALIATPLSLALGLVACGNDNNAAVVPPPVAVAPAPAPAPAPSPSPTPTPSPASRNVTACLNQVIPGTGGVTPTALVIPDTLRLSFASPNGFPNGRQLNDPVVDIELAALLLDLRVHSTSLLANLPLNPRPDDPILSVFPFFAPALGGQPAPGTGTAFSFRTDPVSAYTRVDRMGQPAIAAVLIGGTQKTPFADANLADDIAGVFVPGPDGIVQQLTNLHNQIADDLIVLGLTPCST